MSDVADFMESGARAGMDSTEYRGTYMQDGQAAIDFLRPGTHQHTHLLQFLCQRLRYSEKEMTKFHNRWNYNEVRLQAYINVTDYEKLLKQQNEAGEPASKVQVSIPYAYATISTIVTYQLQAFAGKRPIFTVNAQNAESTQSAPMMEQLLQYQMDHTRFISHLFQFLQDAQTYGVAILHTHWKEEKGMRTRYKQAPLSGIVQNVLGLGGGGWVKSRERVTTYAGNMVECIDPFMFFPDPRVPMREVNKKGEFVFWRTFVSKSDLLIDQAAGDIKYVDRIGTLPRSSENLSGQSKRTLLSDGDTDMANAQGGHTTVEHFVQIDQGSVVIVPKMFGLGDSEVPEKWVFTIANERQIIAAEKSELDHGMHPIVVAEPYSLGYGFGMPGMMDWLGPLQDTMSWLINSHMQNVATAINNMWVVNPSKIEMQDLKEPGAGKIIRMKPSAYGQDLKDIIHQLPVQDVTRGHVEDLALFRGIADAMASVSDNLRGLQDSGGRKTATEVRISTEAGASRLASNTRIISAQAMVDLGQMLSLNTQQFLSEEMSVNILGQDGKQNLMNFTPMGIVGDFNFPVHDGTLPIDKVAMLDVWQQILIGVAQDPQLRNEFSLPKIFEYVAELGGAKNIEEFKVQTAPGPEGDEALMNDVQAGNKVDIRTALAGGGGTEANPASRLQGA